MKVNTIDVDYAAVCKNSNYFRSLENFKEARTTDLMIEDLMDIDPEILQTFLVPFLQKNVNDAELLKVIEYSYDIRQLMTFFGCDKWMENYFDSLLELFLSKLKCNLAHINAQIMISFYYLYKTDKFDLNKYIEVLYLDKEYLTIMDEVRSEMESQADFFELYDIWLQPFKGNVSLSMKQLVSVFSFDLTFVPHQYEAKVKNDLRFKDGDKHCVAGIDDFKQRLNQFVGGIDLADLDWKNVVIAGGSVLACILRRDWLASSDLDLWIYGMENNDAGVARMKELIAYFTKKIGRPAIYIKNRSIITLCFADFHRNIQLILTEKPNPMEVIAEYDIDYICCIYDGATVWGTTHFMRALISQTCADRDTVRMDRLLKAWLKGYSLLYGHNFNKEDEVAKKAKIERILNKYYYPTEREFADKTRLKIMATTFIKGECYFAAEDIKYEGMEGFDIDNYDDASSLNNITFGIIPKTVKWNYEVLNNTRMFEPSPIRGMDEKHYYGMFKSPITLITDIAALYQIKLISKWDKNRATICYVNEQIDSLATLSELLNKRFEAEINEFAKSKGLKRRYMSSAFLVHGNLYRYIKYDDLTKYGITESIMNEDLISSKRCGAQYKIALKGVRIDISHEEWFHCRPQYEILDVKFFPEKCVHNSRRNWMLVDDLALP